MMQTGSQKAIMVSGAEKEVGKYLPTNCKNLQLYLIDATRSMQQGKVIPVQNGQARFTFDATSYVTLISQ